MNFILKMMGFVPKMIDFVLKIMDLFEGYGTPALRNLSAVAFTEEEQRELLKNLRPDVEHPLVRN